MVLANFAMPDTRGLRVAPFGSPKLAIAIQGTQAVTFGITNPAGTAEDPGATQFGHDRFVNAFGLPSGPSGVGGHWWQNDTILELSAPPVWTTGIQVTLLRNLQTFGVKSGLYNVRDRTSQQWILGFGPGVTGVGNLVVVKKNLVTHLYAQQEIAVPGMTGEDTMHMGVWHQGLFWLPIGDGQVLSYDPVTDFVNLHLASTASPHDYAKLVIAQGRLFWVGVEGTNVVIKEHRGSFFLQIAHGVMPSADVGATGQIGVHNISGTINIFYNASGGPGGGGIRFFAWNVGSNLIGDPNVVGGEFTTPVIPPEDSQGTPPWPNATAAWSYDDVNANTDPNQRIHCFLENNRPDLGFLSSRPVWFESDPFASNMKEVWAFQGNAAPMFQNTSLTAPAHDAPGDLVTAAGDQSGDETHQLTPNALTVQIWDVQQVPGTNDLEITFFVAAPAFTPGLRIKLFHMNPAVASQSEAALLACTLKAPVTGVDRNATPAVLDIPNNRVTDVAGELVADVVNPPTLYTVRWDPSADGVPFNVFAKVTAKFDPNP